MGKRSVKVNTAELAPTQATIGGFEVLLKSDRYKLMSPSAIEDYLTDKKDRGKPPQVVKGLHRYFVVDGHHTLSGILKAWKPRELEVELREDYSHLQAPEDFWKKMVDEGLFYDRCLGETVKPIDLPGRFEDLLDDPFRSVAWLIRKMGAYDDLKLPYQEFRVADFLREHMPFAPVEYYEYETACLRGFELIRSVHAKKWAKKNDLPGLKDDEGVPNGLVDIYYDVLTAVRRPRYN